MEEKTKKLLDDLSNRTGRPLAELQATLEQHIKEFKASIPNQTEAQYEDYARRRLYIDMKSELASPAKPYDMLILGSSAPVDVTTSERAEKRALWEKSETRAQAIAEKKVAEDGTPLDTRVWLVPPKPDGTGGRKNPRYGKPLEELIIRNIVGFGRPASGGTFKIVSIVATGKQASLVPPKGKTVRVRLNLRQETDTMYICNGSRRMEYEPIEIPELGAVDTAKICEILETAPVTIHPSLSELLTWHKAHEKDARRVVIFSGDVTRINRDPTAFGSYLVVIEDTSNLDLEAEGTPVWTSEEPDYGVGSRIYGIARTTIGPGYNRDTGQLDSSIERIQLNALAIFAHPQFRVAPEEEEVIGGEEVK